MEMMTFESRLILHDPQQFRSLIPAIRLRLVLSKCIISSSGLASITFLPIFGGKYSIRLGRYEEKPIEHGTVQQPTNGLPQD
jgi:hypothetical protein